VVLDSVKFRLDSRLGKSTVNCIHKLKVCKESCGYTLQLENKRTLCSVTKPIHTKPASRLARINAGMHVAHGRWQTGSREACYAKGDTHGGTSSHLRVTRLTQLPTYDKCQECSETQKLLRPLPTRCTNTYRLHQQDITEWLGMGQLIPVLW